MMSGGKRWRLKEMVSIPKGYTGIQIVVSSVNVIMPFGKFQAAGRTIQGYETMRMIRKGQARRAVRMFGGGRQS